MNKSTVKVLLIDDEPEVRSAVSYLLRLNGLEVIEAESGQKGIDLARSTNPSVILSDIKLEGTNGFDVFDQLQKESTTAKIPFLFMTGWADTTILDQIKQRGQTVLEKPFNVEILMRAVMARL